MTWRLPKLRLVFLHSMLRKGALLNVFTLLPKELFRAL
jgi:hypothetical protein